MEKFRKAILTGILLMIGVMFCRGEENRIVEIAALRETADSLHNVGRTDSAVLVGEKAIRLAENIGRKRKKGFGLHINGKMPNFGKNTFIKSIFAKIFLIMERISDKTDNPVLYIIAGCNGADKTK